MCLNIAIFVSHFQYNYQISQVRVAIVFPRGYTEADMGSDPYFKSGDCNDSSANPLEILSDQ